MQLQERINAFSELGRFLGQFKSENSVIHENIALNGDFYHEMHEQLEQAKNHNGWFTLENLFFTCESWSEALSKENITKWTSKYTFRQSKPKTVAVIMAGNIPLVGFHDFLSVLMSGNKILAKLSSKDAKLLPYLAKYLIAVEPKFEAFITFTDGRLNDFDAVIATGSTNSARYFDFYFKKYPSIIRKNRNSVAVLTGNETPHQMEALANDIFRYFGLGCRNVSKLFIPENYNMDLFFNGVYSWKEIVNNNKYINNYDYNKAVYLMSNIDLLDNEFLLLKKDEDYSSPISVVFYEYYTDLKSVKKKLEAEAESLQCVVSQAGIENEIGFGLAQKPHLWDYADGVDTMKFLLKLS